MTMFHDKSKVPEWLWDKVQTAKGNTVQITGTIYAQALADSDDSILIYTTMYGGRDPVSGLEILFS